MESIVSPWIIYLLSILDCKEGFTVIGIMLSLLWIVLSVLQVCLSASQWNSTKKDAETLKSAMKQPICKGLKVLCVVCMFWAFFVPNKNTVIQMYIANEITYDRAEKAVEIGKDIKASIKKDVIDIIQEITRDDNGDSK